MKNSNVQSYSYALLLLYFSNLANVLKAFDNGIIDNFVGISYTRCIAECESNFVCAFIKFSTRFHHCKLYQRLSENSTITLERGFTVYEKNIVSQSCDNNRNASNCMVKACPVPQPVSDAEMFGNILTIGSTIKYKCIQSVRALIIKCEENGSWTGGTLYCICQPPENIDHGHVTSRIRINETHFVLNVTCDEGYTRRQNGDITCDVSDERWTVENICCDKTADGEWQKVYSYPKKTDLDLVGNLYYLHGSMEREIGSYCFFRNTTIFENWESVNISRVKFVIKLNKEVAAFLIFNGTGSKHLQWFTQSRLLNSSWNDLNASSTLSQFSIDGFSSTTTSNLRFFISQRFSVPGYCYEDLGWFVVSWSYYPCDSTITGKRILYAKNNNVSRFVTEEFGFADRYEFWIERGP